MTGDLVAGLPQAAQDGEAVDDGQADVEQEQVVLAGGGLHQGLSSVADDMGPETGGAESLVEEGGDPGLVLGDQHAVHVADLSTARWGWVPGCSGVR
jgi:hypothetical protein